MNHRFIVPCLFGLEGLAADELRRMQLEEVAAENGRVSFAGDLSALVRANLRLRTGERVLLEVGSFEAKTFDTLFEQTKALPWERWIGKDAAFPVAGHSLNSALFSVPDCQKIIKKAVVERLKSRYHIAWFAESAETVQIRFSIMKDRVSLCLDTSGEGLHKRGYRPAHNAAPFCGSGTIPIEAALIARNVAPGLNRHFAAMDWRTLDGGLWQEEKDLARSLEYHADYRIFASDLDPKAVAMAKANAERAGVADLIRFETADARHFARETERGVIVTNPPYGERIGEKEEAEDLYRAFGAAFRGLSNWQLYLLSSHTEFERCFGAEADKKRKLYNGMIKCDLFMFYQAIAKQPFRN